ncbi:unnamed protein product [Ophioblennius macclurei]
MSPHSLTINGQALMLMHTESQRVRLHIKGWWACGGSQKVLDATGELEICCFCQSKKNVEASHCKMSKLQHFMEKKVEQSCLLVLKVVHCRITILTNVFWA